MMRTRQLDWMEPMDAARRLACLPRLSFLDSSMVHPTLGRFSYVAADPFGVFRADETGARWNGEPEAGAPLAALRRRLARYRAEPRSDMPPFQSGAIGSFAYEFGWALEGVVPPAGRRAPDIDLAFYDVVLAFDHIERRSWLMSSGHSAGSPAAQRERADARLAVFEDHLAHATRSSDGAAIAIDWRPTISRTSYCANVDRVTDYIRAGDIYQANIAQRFVATLSAPIDTLCLYERLRTVNPAPFSAFLAQGERALLSTSPELFLRSDGRFVETRPIKGTSRRHDEPIADAAAARGLAASCKDRAENVMIVDLLRNDLSRVCEPTSVEVSTLCAVESYAGLHHLVSAVGGTLRQGCDGLDLVAATFPGGSITGAPKRRAMEIIAEIEGEPRGLYCGAIGSIGFDGSMQLNVAIRTLVVEDAVAELQVGGGITILSDPDAEYEETLTKGRRIFDAFMPARASQEVCA